MSGFLLDAKVPSEYNNAAAPHPGVVRWIETTPDSAQYISVLQGTARPPLSLPFPNEPNNL